MSAISATSSSHSSSLPQIPVGTYIEMTKRVPKEDMDKIEAKMDSLSKFETTLSEIQMLWETGRYNELPEDAFYYALRGLKEDKAPAKMAARISDIETLRLQGIKFTVSDLSDLTNNPNFILEATGGMLQGELAIKFTEELKNLPREDRFVMSFKSNLPPPSFETMKNRTISTELENNGMNILNIVERQIELSGEISRTRLFASLEAYEVFLKVLFGDDYVKGNPVFGISTLEQIAENGKTNTRDICHFYLVPDKANNRLVTYPEADNFRCTENAFNYHDRFHQLAATILGTTARADLMKKATQFQEEFLNEKAIALLSKQDHLGTKKVYTRLVDMDFIDIDTLRFYSSKVFSPKPELITESMHRFKRLQVLSDRGALPLSAIFETIEQAKKVSDWILKNCPENPQISQ